MKNIISYIVLFSLIISTNFGFFQTFAVDTNESSNPWTIQKARHLAKKALFGATKENIQQLYDIGSAQNAVNILFPSRNGPSKTAYQEKLNNLINDPDFDPNNSNDIYKYYLAKKLYDPYEAKAKLFLLFEDTFSVNVSGSKNITYLDIENTHELLYNNMFGDYKELIKKTLYNNGDGGDYSVSQFLDLFNQSNPSRPNENYARELLQLLLMGEYKPFESEEIDSIRNYSEVDVAALAKILVGFETNENTHTVSYNNSANTNSNILFLEGEFQNTINTPYYNQESGEIDVQLLKNSINSSNGLPDNIIDYIFAKKQDEIADFLAYKLYNFYVGEQPNLNEIDLISNNIISHDFDLYLSIKWLLSSDIMYSERSMNTVIYKNPIELVVGTKKILDIDNLANFKTSSKNLGWTPYYPGSIFGRDGFENNEDFFNATSVIKWSYEASKMIDEIDVSNYVDSNMSLDENIKNIETKLLGDEILSNSTRDQLKFFMTHDKDGNEITFEPTSSQYNDFYTASLLYFILSQPEYILQTGVDIPSDTETESKEFYGNDNKLVIIKYRGGLDWLHGVIQKDEYAQYLENRENGALELDELVEVGDYYLNAKMSDFKGLYDTGDLKIFNRVGTPEHSRSHDTASRKMSSAYSEGSLESSGILGEFIKNEDPLKTVQLGGDKGLVFRGGQYLQIGNDGLFRLDDNTNTDFRIHKLDTLKNIYDTRNYPENLDYVFKNGAYIGNVAETSVANGGRSGAGYSMNDTLDFTETLFDAGVTNVVRIAADGGYDTHGNQKENLSNNLQKVAEKTAEFYNSVKDKHDVTIVLYSEFGRTLKINSSLGTDHGKGGGMFILSNNSDWKETLPEKVYGNNSFINAQANRLGVGIDYRSIYKTIYDSLYQKDISESLGGEFNINDYIDDTIPTPKLFRIEYEKEGSRMRTHLVFNVEDTNYFHTQGSHIRFSYGTDKDNMRSENRYNIDRYMADGDKQIDLYIRNTNQNTKYYYKIEMYDNQYNENIINGEFVTPNYNNSSEKDISIGNDTFLSKYNNTAINNQLSLNNDDIVLSSSGSILYDKGLGVSMETSSGTYVKNITSNTGSTWNGGFILPTEINKDYFISNLSTYNDTKLSNINNLEKIIQVGSDINGIGMELNQEVDLIVNNINSSTNYGVLISQDGIQWERVSQNKITKANNNLNIKTNHFSYFAIVGLDNNGNIELNTTQEDTVDNGNSSGSSSSGGSGSPRYSKDICPYGDYSSSYYDKTCGKDLSAKEIYALANSYSLKDNISYNIENDQINNALDELELYESDKLDIFNEIFDTVDSSNSDQQKVLKFIRQDISEMNVNNYDIYYIKNGKRNELFKKISLLLTQQSYKDTYEENLLNSVNGLILALAIKEDLELSESTKNKVNTVLQEKVKSLKFHYLQAQNNKEVVTYITPKNVNNSSESQKTEAYYRTRKDEIIKKHKQK